MAFAIRDRLKDRAQRFLEPGEQVQVAFAAQTHSQWIILAGLLPFLLLNKYRAIVVTDRRILVIDSGRWAATACKTVIRSLPRATLIGPAAGLWYKFSSLGETLRVHMRFHRDIGIADQATSAPNPVPMP